MRKNTKINFSHTVIIRTNDGKIGYVDSNIITHKTLEGLREEMKKDVDIMIDSLKKSTRGHTCTHGIVVHPLIHIIHDDQAIDNTDYQNYLKEEKNTSEN